MAKWTPLSRNTHANRHYQPRQNFAHTRRQRLAPAMLGELSMLVPHYVLAFIQQDDAFRPMVLMAAPRSDNLYLNAQDQWALPYVPAALRAYPFALARTAERALFSIDIASLCEAPHGEPLFDAEGKMTEWVQNSYDFLTRMEGERKATEHAADQLQSAGIIEPWPLTLNINEQAVGVEGLFRINEKAMNALEASAYHALQGAPMMLAYAQLYSMAQIPQFMQRAGQQQQHQQPVEDIDELFGSADDTLKFNF